MGEHDAAGDAGRGRQGALHETAAGGRRGLLRRAAPRARLRRIGRLLGRGRVLALVGGIRRIGRTLLRGRLALAAAAEQRSAEIAEEAGLLLRLALLGLRFELGEPPAGVLQRLLLDEDRLGEHIGRVRIGPDGVIDEGFRLRIARRRGGRSDAFEQAGEQLAFFGGHRGSPIEGP